MTPEDHSDTLATLTEELEVMIDVVAWIRADLAETDCRGATRVVVAALHDAVIDATRAVRADRSLGSDARRALADGAPF